MLRWLPLIWLLVFPGWVGAADALVPLPPLAARVTDLTATLAPEQRAQLEASIAAIERDKGAQVAILMLPSVQPETIEQFGIRLAEAWKIGRRGVNDGVIVIVAKNDRKMRIEVGYGLEGAIPDAVAKRIVAETMAPRFKAGDFFGGLEAAVASLGKIIAGEALPPAVGSDSATNLGTDGDALPMLIFVVIVLAGMARKILGVLGSLLAAGLAGWLALSVFGSWLAAGLAGLAAFAFSFARLGGGRSGWHAGGGGFSSSDSGGGGFSGGGGDFGGGGASGDW